ncbi:hypothetical protein U5B43_08945 [Campylobacter sp. 9BO]|uniref:hypothetical protein n=1 Tax=Campylobacter sp. 9BO TaxID=3424759 RepID=UPI003D34F2C4
MKAFISSFDEMASALKRAEKNNASFANYYIKCPNEQQRAQIITRTNEKLKQLNSKEA